MENAIEEQLKMLNKLIIATGNPGKFREFEFLFNSYGKNFTGKLIFAPEIADLIIEETGKTYAENAVLKARSWVKASLAIEKSGLPCLADDSGLEVEALDGRPGIFSARVAKGNETGWILNELGNTGNRRAKFMASLALCMPDGRIFTGEGFCNGTITDSPRGSSGFGYDPVFMPDGYSKTFAELAPGIKNSISHRTKAFINLISHAEI